MRLFVAIDLDDEAKDAVAAEQKRIADALSAGGSSLPKWVRPVHMHMTLVFLGEVVEQALPPVVDAICSLVDVASFAVAFERLGVFPPHGAPRVLWLGVGEGASQVADIQRRVTARLEGTGIVLDRRRFDPHLTLGRWRYSRPTDRRRVLELDRQTVVARLSVDHVTLFQSQLGPAGPIHTAVTRATLT
jgi:2'-5' RNA ligase